MEVPKNIVNRLCLILWFSACIFFSIDTGLFVYMSLSQTLLGGLCAIGMMFTVLTDSIKSCRGALISKLQILFLLWMVYMIIHAMVIHEAELYKLLYLELSLSILISIPYMVRYGLLSRHQIENGILLMLWIQIVCLLMQALGFVDSFNTYYRLTGLNENPNVTAILIAACMPVVYERLKQERKAYLYILLGISFIFLLLLKCRTAYLGIAVVGLFRFITLESVRKHMLPLTKKSLLILSIVFIILSVGVLSLYSFKRDSADGRLMIWKLSSQMIKDKPQGIGIGLFEHDYNLEQGTYFEQGQVTEKEKRLASTVYMAYNDYIEHGVEMGYIGMLFLIGFYISLLIRAYQKHMGKEGSVVCGFAVMACCNFVCATVQPWLVLLCYAGFIVVGKEIPLKEKSRYNGQRALTIIMGFAFLLVSFYQVRMTFSQWKLCSLQNEFAKEKVVEIPELENLSSKIYTSEAYWSFMAKQYYYGGQYEKALFCIEQALKYSSESSLYFLAFNCYDKIGCAEKGIPYLLMIKNMIPLNLTSRFMLLKCYDKLGFEDNALSMATEILQIPVKVNTAKSDKIRKSAKAYLLKYKKDKKR